MHCKNFGGIGHGGLSRTNVSTETVYLRSRRKAGRTHHRKAAVPMRAAKHGDALLTRDGVELRDVRWKRVESSVEAERQKGHAAAPLSSSDGVETCASKQLQLSLFYPSSKLIKCIK